MINPRKQKIIIANWKMNPASLADADKIISKIKPAKKSRIKIIICPPFVWLNNLIKKHKQIDFGGQNCFWEEKGAYTGEISPLMLKSAGCKYVILGHSERRKYFNEDYNLINLKLKIALQAGLKIILCVGETEKDENKKYDEISNQIKSVFDKVFKQDISNIIIAYEPVWTIGTGDPDTPENAVSSAILIKKLIIKLYGHQIFPKIKILYGGSINSKSAKDFLNENEIDGLLVGGASLNTGEFIKIIS